MGKPTCEKEEDWQMKLSITYVNQMSSSGLFLVQETLFLPTQKPHIHRPINSNFSLSSHPQSSHLLAHNCQISFLEENHSIA